MKNEIKNFLAELSINQEEINKIATDAARKAITRELESYYNDYDSPFRKEIRKYLEAHQPPINLTLPDCTEIINSGLTAEIDKICSEISVKNYAATLRKALTGLPTREDGSITITDLGNKLCEHVEFTEYGDYLSITLEDEPYEGFIKASLAIVEEGEKREYNFTLSRNNHKEKFYHILSMPFGTNDEWKSRNIKVKTEDNTVIEIPSFAGVHSDVILAVIASVIIHNVAIDVDTYDFIEEYGNN